jgi:charged multivesicular body protein 4
LGVKKINMNLIPSWWWGSQQQQPTKTPSTMEVVNQTDDSIDGLECRIMQARKKAHDLLKEAQQEKDKKRQLQLMRRKQQYDKQIQQMELQVANLEQTSNVVMSASMAQDVVGAMKNGSNAIKGITSTISVDEVEDVTDELNNNMQDMNDIQSALSRPIGMDVLDQEEQNEDILKEIASWSEKEDTEVAQRIEQEMPTIPKKVAVKNNNDNNNNNNDNNNGHEKIVLD